MTTETESTKRPAEQEEQQPEAKKIKTEGDDNLQPIKRAPMSKARENRLEQNRKAARESRRRKKLMIEELQRSVIFFSKANGALKMQNEELGRRFMEAQSRVAAVEGNNDAAHGSKMEAKTEQPNSQFVNEQAQAQAVATQAMYESQGFPAGAARAAAQAMNGATTLDAAAPTPSVPQMQPGATMQAMAAFQQAAHVAMSAAMGMNPTAAMSGFQQPGMPMMGFNMMPMSWPQQTKAPLEPAVPQQQQQEI